MFKTGDKVRLLRDQKALHTGPEIFKAGETGTLGEMYRIQDGFEVWHLVLDRPGYVFIAVAHPNIEKI